MQPLKGLRVLDFTTLLPGPLASLLLAEAGAEVIKIERPGRGEEMRQYEPKVGADSVNFVLLNRGKRSVSLDLKSASERARLLPLVADADVLLEQFRPGVMGRLGLDYESLRRTNPRLIYCSITGWGQSGPKSPIAAHDLNYMAETGVLGISAAADGAPVLPPLLAADIAGGAYPAVMNVLLALKQRDATGAGCYIDVAMAENLFSFMYWGLGAGFATQRWPATAGELVSGGSPRYQIYRTADHRYVAAAPLEDKFWATFCSIIELPEQYRGADVPAADAIRAVSQRIASKTAEEWRRKFAGHDLCCSIVLTLQEAVADPHFEERRVFARRVSAHGREVPALPVPIAPAFRSDARCLAAPTLGAAAAQWSNGVES